MVKERDYYYYYYYYIFQTHNEMVYKYLEDKQNKGGINCNKQAR